MLVKNIFKYGLIAIIASVLTAAEAKPSKGKGKPRPEKVDKEKLKERFEAAAEKRKKHIERNTLGFDLKFIDVDLSPIISSSLIS